MSKIIHQIWLSDKTKVPEHIKKNIKTLPKLYSGYQYNLYNNEKIVNFLKNNFSNDVLLAYDKCKPYSFKSDLARFCLLYVYGGYYFDVSICPNFKFESAYDAFALKGESVEIDGIIHENLDNGVMYFKNPKSSFLKAAIDTAIDNILHHRYGKHSLDVTGPMMLHRLDHSSIHLYPCSRVDGRKVVCIEDKEWFQYPNGFSNLQDEQNKNYGTNNYADMWFKKDVFKGAFKL